MENLKKLSMGKVNITQTNLMFPQIIDCDSKDLNWLTQGRGGKSTKSPNMKSPKAGKGKKSTTWDPVLYGGKVNKEEVSTEFDLVSVPFKYK